MQGENYFDVESAFTEEPFAAPVEGAYERRDFEQYNVDGKTQYVCLWLPDLGTLKVTFETQRDGQVKAVVSIDFESDMVVIYDKNGNTREIA